MKKYCIGIVFLMLICLCGCFLTKPKEENRSHTVGASNNLVSGIFKGTSKDSENNILLEVELDENVITHIELLSFNEDISFDKMSIELFDNIICKNSLDVDLPEPQAKELVSAVESALIVAGISKNDLVEVSTNLDRKPAKKEYTCDLVIVGAGGAGLTSAIEAKTQGINNVIVLEKMSFTGGNTRMSGGGYGAPCNWVQESEGIVGDSNNQYFKDIYEGSYGTGNPELIHILADNALEDAIWLRDFVGVKFKDYQTWYEGHTYKRTLRALGDGSQFIDTLLAKAEQMGVQVHYTTRATHLIEDKNGKVIGVEAEKGGDFINYKAINGVILASGGFGANEKLLEKYNTEWNSLEKNALTTNSPAIMGDGLIMAEEVGAKLIDMNYIQLYPINNPATGNFYLVDYARLNDNALLVNKEGYRFVDELETRDVIARAALRQTGDMVYELIDNRTATTMNIEEEYKEEIKRCFDQGVMVKGSLEECASYMGIPVSTLRHTIGKYNTMVHNRIDTDFGRTNLKPIGEGPYYMFSSVVSIHHTMGGVEIDKYARVLDTDGNVISGLYAAGEVTGGIHGANRLGSVALADSIVFGRIAAQSVVDFYNENIINSDTIKTDTDEK